MEINFLDQFSDRDEWLAWRRTKVTASDVPAIMGESPFKTRSDVLADKLGSSSSYTNKHMQAGLDNEAAALNAAISTLKAQLHLTTIARAEQVPIECDNYAATLDAYCCCRKRGGSPVSFAIEVKCVNLNGNTPVKDKIEVPKKYRGQLQWQRMLLPEDALLFYAEFDLTEKRVVISEPVQLDSLYVEKARAEADKLLSELANKDDAPDHDTAYCLSRYKQLYEEMSRLKFEMKEVSENIKLLSGGKNICYDGVLVEWKDSFRTDYSKIPELEGVDLTQYQTKSRVASFKIVK